MGHPYRALGVGRIPADVLDRRGATAPGGGDPLVGGLVTSVAELVREGAWTRFRVCGNGNCRAVFYDTTRSRSQRWHSYELCGNRANVAAYRTRKRTAADPGGDA